MPNDLVTRPVPVRLDDVVCTEQIMNCFESEASEEYINSEQAQLPVETDAEDLQAELLPETVDHIQQNSIGLHKNINDGLGCRNNVLQQVLLTQASDVSVNSQQSPLMLEKGVISQQSSYMPETGVNNQQSSSLTQTCYTSVAERSEKFRQASSLPHTKISGQKSFALQDASVNGQQTLLPLETSDSVQASSSLPEADVYDQQSSSLSETCFSGQRTPSSPSETCDDVQLISFVPEASAIDQQSSPLLGTGVKSQQASSLPEKGFDDKHFPSLSNADINDGLLLLNKNLVSLVQTNSIQETSSQLEGSIDAQQLSTTENELNDQQPLLLSSGGNRPGLHSSELQDVTDSLLLSSQNEMPPVISNVSEDPDINSETSTLLFEDSKKDITCQVSLQENEQEKLSNAKALTKEDTASARCEQNVSQALHQKNNTLIAAEMSIAGFPSNEIDDEENKLDPQESGCGKLLQQDTGKGEQNHRDICGDQEDIEEEYNSETSSYPEVDLHQQHAKNIEAGTKSTVFVGNLSSTHELSSGQDENELKNATANELCLQSHDESVPLWKSQLDDEEGTCCLTNAHSQSFKGKDGGAEQNETSSNNDVMDEEVALPQNSVMNTSLISRDSHISNSGNQLAFIATHTVNPSIDYRSLLRESVAAPCCVDLSSEEVVKDYTNDIASDNHDQDKEKCPYLSEKYTPTDRGIYSDEHIDYSDTNTTESLEEDRGHVEGDAITHKSQTKTENNCELKMASSFKPGRPVAKAKKKSVNRSFALSGFLEQLEVENVALNSLALAKTKILNGKAESEEDVLQSHNLQEKEQNPQESSSEHNLIDGCSTSFINENQGKSPCSSKLKTVEKIPELSTGLIAVEDDLGNGKNEKFNNFSISRLNRKLESHTNESYQHQSESETENGCVFAQVCDIKQKSGSMPVSLKNSDGMFGGRDIPHRLNAEYIIHEANSIDRLKAKDDSGKLNQVSHSETATDAENGAQNLKESSKPQQQNRCEMNSILIDSHQFQPGSSFFDLEKEFEMFSRSYDGSEQIPSSGCTIFQNAQFLFDDPSQFQAHCKAELKRLEDFKIWWTEKRKKATEERIRFGHGEIFTPLEKDYKLPSKTETPPTYQRPLSKEVSSFEKALYEHVKAREENIERKLYPENHAESCQKVSIQREMKENASIRNRYKRDQHIVSPAESLDDGNEKYANNEECKKLDEAMLKRRKLRKAAKKTESVEDEGYTGAELKNLGPMRETSIRQVKVSPDKTPHSSPCKPENLEISNNSSQFLAEYHSREEYDFQKNKTNNATLKELNEKSVTQMYDYIEPTNKIMSQNVNVTNVAEKGENNSEIHADPLKTIGAFVIDDQNCVTSEKALLDNNAIASERTPSTGDIGNHPGLKKSAKKSLTPIFDAVHRKQLFPEKDKNQQRKQRVECGLSHTNSGLQLKTLFPEQPKALSSGNHEKLKRNSPDAEIGNQIENTVNEKQFTEEKHKEVRRQTRHKKIAEEQVCKSHRKKYLSTQKTILTKPSKSAARLAGLEVSDGSTSPSSLSLSQEESPSSGASETDSVIKTHINRAYVSKYSYDQEDREDVSPERNITESSELDDYPDDLLEYFAYYKNYPSNLSQYHYWYQSQLQNSSHPCWVPSQHQHWPVSNQPQSNHRDRFPPLYRPSSSGLGFVRPIYPYHHYYQSCYYDYDYPSSLTISPFLYQHNLRDFQSKSFNMTHPTESFFPSADASATMQWKYICHMTKQSVRLAKMFERSEKLSS